MGRVDDLTEDAAAELRLVRAEIAALRGHLAAVTPTVTIRHGWLKHVIKDLETNPRTQYKVHFWGVIYWLINFPLVCYLFFGQSALWLKLGIFITLIYSIYANFATDYGSMSAAMAAFDMGKALPAIPMDTAGTAAHYQQQQIIHDLLEQNNTLTARIDSATSLLNEIHAHVSALSPHAGTLPAGDEAEHAPAAGDLEESRG